MSLITLAPASLMSFNLCIALLGTYFGVNSDHKSINFILLFFRYNFLCNTSASIWMFMFHILNIQTSNLPNLLLIGIRGTQFMSCIYRVPISIYVSLIRHMRREHCTIWKHILPDWTIHTVYLLLLYLKLAFLHQQVLYIAF